MIVNAHDVDVIADHISPSRQGWTREVTVRTMGHKVRATVYRDSYDFQSRIKVEVWNPAELKWNAIRHLDGSDHGDLPNASTLGRGRMDPLRAEPGKREIFHGTADLVDELIAYAQEVLA